MDAANDSSSHEAGHASPTPISAMICDPGEVSYRLHSRVQGPICELDFLSRCLLMAELAMIAYNDEEEARRAFRVVGFPDTTLYDRDGAQAFRIRNDDDCVIACRGTESNEWNDIRADARVISVLAETAGRVHRGFKREVDDLWPMLETALMGNDQTLWFCGHSLGGAMATICASRCFLSHIESNPAELYTYGSPRVGNQRYVNFVKLKHYRFVNNNDIVTREPPVWLGYRHSGTEIYLDHWGRIRNLHGVKRELDRILGFLASLLQWRFDHFADHSIHRYIEVLALAVESDRAKPLPASLHPVNVDDPSPSSTSKQPTARAVTIHRPEAPSPKSGHAPPQADSTSSADRSAAQRLG